MNTPDNRRILLIDDMAAIHGDFRKILTPDTRDHAGLDAAEEALFGAPKEGGKTQGFELDSAYQGQEGLAKLQLSLQAARPYAMAFVDMRMPPGWNGMETIEHLWRADDRLQIVICTAYSDVAWDEALQRLEARDRLLILKKPFDAIEVHQLASALCSKWTTAQRSAGWRLHLEDAVRERTREISRTNEALQAEISERKHLQGQLVQSEKLASIGQLAAGVAHEINNPIGYVYSNFSTLDKYLGDLFEMLAAYEHAESALGNPQTAKSLEELRQRIELDFLKQDIPDLMRESREGIVRVRKIVKDLKDFSHVDADPQWQMADLVQGIDSTLNVVNNEVKYKADLVKQYGELPEVQCLASEINQVVMNLVVNAAHAIGPERGRITISTGTEGGQVWIEVSDTGSGIPPECLDRIFDPFYTTKPVGQGTGLGLSLSYGIVQKHHGRIDVKTQLGVGTSFRVILPIEQPVPELATALP